MLLSHQSISINEYIFLNISRISNLCGFPKKGKASNWAPTYDLDHSGSFDMHIKKSQNQLFFSRTKRFLTYGRGEAQNFTDRSATNMFVFQLTASLRD